jgi:DUF1680 family protein
VTVSQKNCALPFGGSNEMTVSLAQPRNFRLMIRKPAWSGRMQVRINGQEESCPVEDGYLSIRRTWKDGDPVSVSMELPLIKVEAHPYVDADIGRVALMRGPLLYCLEEIDNPGGTDVVLDDSPLFLEETELFGRQIVVKGLTKDGTPFTAIPYYLWNNRGKGTMHVWVRQHGAEYEDDAAQQDSCAQDYAAHRSGYSRKKLCLDGWEGKLYRAYHPRA